MFDKESIKKSYLYGEILKSLSIEFNCCFIDLDTVTKVSAIDGLHYDENGHKAVAEHLQNYFLNLT